jgi:hypothetical protein
MQQHRGLICDSDKNQLPYAISSKRKENTQEGLLNDQQAICILHFRRFEHYFSNRVARSEFQYLLCLKWPPQWVNTLLHCRRTYHAQHTVQWGIAVFIGARPNWWLTSSIDAFCIRIHHMWYEKIWLVSKKMMQRCTKSVMETSMSTIWPFPLCIASSVDLPTLLRTIQTLRDAVENTWVPSCDRWGCGERVRHPD